jgi:hypothetical protein
MRFGLTPKKENYVPWDDNCIHIDEVSNYKSIGHFAQFALKVNIHSKRNFIYLNIPDLIYDTFFILNDSKYVPLYYISDEPIILKEKSIKLSSLFQSITIFFGNNRVIFMGHNISINKFFYLIMYDWNDTVLKDNIITELKLNFNGLNIIDIVKFFSTKLNCGRSIKDIKYCITRLFFDKWTEELYEKFYKIDKPNIDDIVTLALKKLINKQKRSFIDLRYKRLTFIEPLFNPLFKNISKVVQSLIEGNPQPNCVTSDFGMIGKHFFNQDSGLNGNLLYDTVNGYSSILAHRASFKHPFGEGKLPPEVSSIHWTHKGRICTISVANKDPGVTVSLVPDQEIDLRYGIFKFTEDELNRK